MNHDLPKPGERIRLEPYPEVFEVYRAEPSTDRITLGVISSQSRQAQTFVLTLEELAQRVKRLPTLKEDFLRADFLPRDPFLLYAEALRMRLAYTFDPHYAVSVTQVDLLPHQVDAVYRYILPSSRIRFLLADDPGLGKTVVAGLVLKELKARGLAQRVLIVVPAHLQDQWRRELGDWFREDFTILDRGVFSNIYSDEFFQRNPQLITSMDFAKKSEIMDVLTRRQWDLLIVDEAHKLSATRYGRKIAKSQRYLLGEALAPRTTNVLFLTATPHKGDDSAYFLLLELLEPRLFFNETQLKEAAREGNGLPFVLRRSKEQVTYLDGSKIFKKREVCTLSITLTAAERELYESVTAYVRRWYRTVSGKTDRRSRNVALALTVLQRRLSSSLAAIRESLHRRRTKLQNLLREWERRLAEEIALPALDEENLAELADLTDAEWESLQERLEGVTAAETPEELREEIGELDDLIQLAIQAEKAGEEAKVQELRRVVEEHLRHNPEEKLLVFTEFKDTLNGLKRKFEQEWGFPVAVIHGDMNLQARVEQERFFRDRVQVMVATDAAGEGINLQFCRLMVNFDLPWNPNRLEQRMGRIHRYGQTRECFVFNLLYPETREGTVLQRLLQKLELMRQRLGDTVYDVIGMLLEGVRLEEMIMRAIVEERTGEIERVTDIDVEKRLEEFRRALEENALAGHHIDRSAVLRDDQDSRLRRLVPWDVQRFTQLAVSIVGGRLDPDRKKDGIFHISVPREFVRQHHLQGESYARGLRVAFERSKAREGNAEFFAPGHPLFEALCEHFLNKSSLPVKGVLTDEKGRDGQLWLFRGRVQDGHGKPVIERLLALFYDRHSKEVREVDPRMLWELRAVPDGWSPPPETVDNLEAVQRIVQQYVTQQIGELQDEAQARRDRECQIKRRWLEHSFDQLISESNAKLFEYHRRAEAGEDMRIAIHQEEENLKALVRERGERLKALEKERTLMLLEPELVAVALIVPKQIVELPGPPPEPEDLKRQVEQAGMAEAMRYEREHGREPQDVSEKFLGYDILSVGTEEIRYIEVKAFSETGPVELTAHEWQMAQRLGNSYWLYVVENALTEPKLHAVQNPTRLSAQPVVNVIKVVIEQWKGTE